jgi:hypothetical protein
MDFLQIFVWVGSPCQLGFRNSVYKRMGLDPRTLDTDTLRCDQRGNGARKRVLYSGFSKLSRLGRDKSILPILRKIPRRT